MAKSSTKFKYDLILKNATIVNHDGINKNDVAIKNSRIVNIGNHQNSEAYQIINCQGLHILPGVIDTQVHFREPGLEYKEDLQSGSIAAVMGGVTALFEMPNTNPSTTTIDALKNKLKLAQNMWCDHAFYIGAAKDNINDLPMLEQLEGCCGVKIFVGSSTGSLLIEDDKSLDRIFSIIKRRFAVHSEDEYRLNERLDKRITGDVSSHPNWRDSKCAIKSTKRILKIAKKYNAKAHILHISTKDEIELLAKYKDLVSVEVTPQHLTLSAPNCYKKLGSYAQMNPPIRSKKHQRGLWDGLNQGTVDVIGTDHAPHTIEEKEQEYPKSPSGMPSVQTLVPIMLNHVNNGKLSLERFVDLTSHGPNRLFQLAGKGRLAKGYDADITIIDMNKENVIKKDWLKSKCGWSPFEGKKVKGWPIITVIRGNIVMREDELIKGPIGKPIRFLK